MNTTGKANSEAIPAKLRWLAIAAGLVCPVCLAPMGLLFGIWLIPLILGAIIQPYSPRPGRLLMWFGAVVLSPWVFYLSGGVAMDTARNLGRYHDAMSVLFLVGSIVSVVLIAWCDIALAMDACRARRVTTVPGQRFPRVTDWIVWLIALCLSLPIIWGISSYPRMYHRTGRLDILITGVVYGLLVLAFDIALIIDATKMMRSQKMANLKVGSSKP